MPSENWYTRVTATPFSYILSGSGANSLRCRGPRLRGSNDEFSGAWSGRSVQGSVDRYVRVDLCYGDGSSLMRRTDIFGGRRFAVMFESIYVVRHGIRQDMEDPTWITRSDRPLDPPLSANGRRQADEVAKVLRSARLTHIFCSPFLRTVQTADAIARLAGVPVFIEDGFCETLDPGWGRRSVLPLQPDTPIGPPSILAKADAAAQYATVQPAYQAAVHPRYPELTHDAICQRMEQTLAAIIPQFTGIGLIVTHSGVMDCVGQYLTGSAAGMDSRMAAINRFDWDPVASRWRLVSASTKHLSVVSNLP